MPFDVKMIGMEDCSLVKNLQFGLTSLQDSYHGQGQAMGLFFSVPEGIKVPSSLGNIYKELQQDLHCSIPSHGNLERWVVQGVLLLNSVLTDLPVKPPPSLHVGTLEPVTAQDWSPLFPNELINKERSNARFVDFPNEVVDIYA